MKNKGLSLVEIIISMTILILIMLPSFLAFSSSNQGILLTDAEFRAHNAAIELVEQIISLPFNMIKPGVYDEKEIIDGNKFADTPAVFHLSFSSEYQPKMTIENIEKDRKIVFKKVTVTINFPIAKGSNQRKDFSLKVIVNNDTN